MSGVAQAPKDERFPLGVIAALEESILECARQTLGNTVRVFETLPGGWNGDGLRRALQHAPGVYVALSSMTRGTKPGCQHARLAVFVVSGGVSGSDRRRGTGRTIGAYQIVERLLPLLEGRLIPYLGLLQVSGVDNLFRDELFDLGGAVYAIGLDLPDLALGSGDEGDLTGFATFPETHLGLAPAVGRDHKPDYEPLGGA